MPGSFGNSIRSVDISIGSVGILLWSVGIRNCRDYDCRDDWVCRDFNWVFRDFDLVLL